MKTIDTITANAAAATTIERIECAYAIMEVIGEPAARMFSAIDAIACMVQDFDPATDTEEFNALCAEHRKAERETLALMPMAKALGLDWGIDLNDFAKACAKVYYEAEAAEFIRLGL